jgi:endoglucanase
MNRHLIILVTTFTTACICGGADHPLRIASEARIIIRSAEENGPLREPRVGPGVVPGSRIDQRLEHGKWQTDICFPIQWWRWSAVDLEFTSSSDGEVEIMLAGPWAATRDGTEIRQEILWDDLQAMGATLENGDFETPGPAAWNSPYAPYLDANEWPLAGAPVLTGKSSAAAWHGRPLTQSLRVKADHQVRLSLHARAATTPDFRVPGAPGADTPAHHACKRLRRGVNLGNGWESAPGEAGVNFSISDIDQIADSGFDHIRVPVAWHHWIDSEGISQKLLDQLDPVLRHALQRGLIVMPVWQNHPELMADPDSHREAFLTGWNTLASHYRQWPPELFFNLLNEPSGELAEGKLTSLYAATIATIRKSNPDRILVVEPQDWSTVGGLDRLQLPDEDQRIIVSIHCYEPFPITHQGASWVGLEELRGLGFPGPPAHPVDLPGALRERSGMVRWIADYNRLPAQSNPGAPAAFEPLLARAAEWSERFGRPVHIGEFGATRRMDADSRNAYAKSFTQAASRYRLPCCWWEWKAGFGCWDSETGKPLLVKPLTGR